jgi:catalase (peroxidase I)
MAFIVKPDEELRIRNLHDAICEYIDEEDLDALYADIEKVLTEERDAFVAKAAAYSSVLNRMFPGTAE